MTMTNPITEAFTHIESVTGHRPESVTFDHDTNGWRYHFADNANPNFNRIEHTMLEDALKFAYNNSITVYKPKVIRVRFTATTHTYVECMKSIEVPDDLDDQELNDYLCDQGRDNICGGEYNEVENSGDWDFNDAYPVGDE